MKKYLDEIFNIITNGTDEFCFKNTEILPALEYIKITGTIQFNRKYNEISITDEYTIQILFPFNYPKKLPIVKEINKRIPSDPDFHNDKGVAGFCFGVPADILRKISHDNTFKFYISEIIIPFLYAHSFYEQYKQYPWPTRSHYQAGLIEFYKEFFQLPDENTAQNFLSEIKKYKNTIKGHILCPCGSNKKFRNCHQKLYNKLIQFYPQKNIYDNEKKRR